MRWCLRGGGAYNCALTTMGGVKCWGLNHRGQLGDGIRTNQTTPVDALQDMRSVAELVDDLRGEGLGVTDGADVAVGLGVFCTAVGGTAYFSGRQAGRCRLDLR